MAARTKWPPTNQDTRPPGQTYNPLVANLALANLLIIACLPIRVVAFAARHFACSRAWSTGGHDAGLGACSPERLTATATVLHQLDQLEDFLLILASPLLWSSLLFFVA